MLMHWNWKKVQVHFIKIVYVRWNFHKIKNNAKNINNHCQCTWTHFLLIANKRFSPYRVYCLHYEMNERRRETEREKKTPDKKQTQNAAVFQLFWVMLRLNANLCVCNYMNLFLISCISQRKLSSIWILKYSQTYRFYIWSNKIGVERFKLSSGKWHVSMYKWENVIWTLIVHYFKKITHSNSNVYNSDSIILL